jgi:hypothetical protein
MPADAIALAAFGTDIEAGWSWPGGPGSVLTANGKPIYCARVGANPNAPAVIPDTTLSLFLQTGRALGGSGSIQNPFRWKPGGMFHLGQTGGANSLMSCASLPAIRGIMSAPETLVLTCDSVQGYVDPLLYQFVGFPNPNGTIQTVAGAFAIILQGSPSFRTGGRGRYACASMMLTPTQIPAQLTRRRIAKSRR